MKKIILALIMTCCVAVHVSAAPNSLDIGTDEWPPYEYTQDGEVKGIATEILQHVFDNMGIKIDKLAIYPWMRLMGIIEDGTVDVAYSAAFNKNRAQHLIYASEPIIESSWVMIIRNSDKDRLSFNTWRDLNGYKLGTVRGYLYNEAFDSFYKKAIHYEAVSADKVNFKKLLNHRVDYIICDYYNAMFLISTLGIADEVHVFENNPVSKTKYYALFSPKTLNKDFALDFSRTLEQFKTSDTYKNILDKYMYGIDNATK